MSELANGKIGSEGSYNVEIKAGKLVVSVAHDSALLDSALTIQLDADAVVDLLVNAVEKMIPGDQTAIANMLKAAVKGAI